MPSRITFINNTYDTGKQLMQRLPAIIILILALTSCGGGGGGASTSPTQGMTIGMKQLQFIWNAVDGADHYRILENPDGASGFSVISGADNISGSSYNVDIPVHLTDWAAAQYMVEACNTDESQCSSILDDALTAADAIVSTGYFKASNTGAGDYFGSSVALSGDGNTLAVGAYWEDSSSTGINSIPNELATDAGAVYLFRKTQGGWSQQAYIKASNAGEQDLFGWSVALSDDGNRLAVGAVHEASGSTGVNSTPDESAPQSGAVYVFDYNGSNWSESAYVKASNTGADDLFGYSVSLSDDGSVLAVGASLEDGSATMVNGTDDDLSNDAGAAYVFTLNNGSWSQQAYLKPTGAGAGDRFGYALALSADGLRLAVSAPYEDGSAAGINPTVDDLAANAGAVYVFSNGSNWQQTDYIKAANSGAEDLFGYSIALSDDGNRLVAGAIYEYGSTSGINTIPDDNLQNAGAVYVFRDKNGWAQQAYIKSPDSDLQDQFGRSIAISGDGSLLTVGTYYEDSSTTGINSSADDAASNSGAAYVYRYTTSWENVSYVKAPNTEAGDYFARSVSVSDNGSTLAISAILEDGASSGIGGDIADNLSNESGAVYLY